MCKSVELYEQRELPVTNGLFSSPALPEPIYFRNQEKIPCIDVRYSKGELKLKAAFYVGSDWLEEGRVQVTVIPKGDKEDKTVEKDNACTDVNAMLRIAFENPEAWQYAGSLVEIRAGKPMLEVPFNHDLLTPLLLIRFLNVMRSIVRKGLRKGYYRREEILKSRVKGKVLVAATIKKQHIRGQVLNTHCSFDEFGINTPENRLLKKALRVAARYLAVHRNWFSNKKAVETELQFLFPAFEGVAEDAVLPAAGTTKRNAFYRDYEAALELAVMLLKHFGHNTHSDQERNRVKVPPYWIDMSKLFELVVLQLLREHFKCKVHYQVTGKRGIADYIIGRPHSLIVDAKYKFWYETNFDLKDVMQVCGYARMKKLLELSGIPESEQENTVPDCLIIYPRIAGNKEEQQPGVPVNLKNQAIEGFVNIYKQAVIIPVIREKGT